MAVDKPRTPAIHRAMAMVDAIWSERSQTPATIATTLGFAKSTVADLLAALQSEGLVRAANTGALKVGGRWAALSDVTGNVDRILRSCARTHELDGHTVSVHTMIGMRVLCLDVRPGQYPLPLTLRPGQYSAVTDSAAAIALLSARPREDLVESMYEYAGHDSYDHNDVDGLLDSGTYGPSLSGKTAQLITSHGLHLSASLPGSIVALSVHLPNRFLGTELASRVSRGVSAALADIRPLDG